MNLLPENSRYLEEQRIENNDAILRGFLKKCGIAILFIVLAYAVIILSVMFG